MKSIRMWIKRIVITSAIVLFIGLLAYFIISMRGGIAGQYAVTDGFNHGYVDIDDGMSGTILGAPHTIYTESVLDMGFCTKDPAIVDKVKKYATRHLHLIIQYRSINDNDLQSLGCERRTENTIVYLIKDVFLSLKGHSENLVFEQIMGIPHDKFYEAPKLP